MNFLAHIFLSANDPEITIGNFIADYVKGRSMDDYPEGIRNGIILHRAIDDFTDHHEITSRSKHLLYPTQGKYAPVVIDMFYDHFLAKNFPDYSEIPLSDFASSAYELFSKNESILPEGVKYFLPYMVERNWLVNYSTIEGISRTLNGLSKRVAFPNNMHNAEKDLRLHYEALESDFRLFFPELITFATGFRGL